MNTAVGCLLAIALILLVFGMNWKDEWNSRFSEKYDLKKIKYNAKIIDVRERLVGLKGERNFMVIVEFSDDFKYSYIVEASQKNKTFLGNQYILLGGDKQKIINHALERHEELVKQAYANDSNFQHMEQIEKLCLDKAKEYMPYYENPIKNLLENNYISQNDVTEICKEYISKSEDAILETLSKEEIDKINQIKNKSLYSDLLAKTNGTQHIGILAGMIYEAKTNTDADTWWMTKINQEQDKMLADSIAKIKKEIDKRPKTSLIADKEIYDCVKNFEKISKENKYNSIASLAIFVEDKLKNHLKNNKKLEVDSNFEYRNIVYDPSGIVSYYIGVYDWLVSDTIVEKEYIEFYNSKNTGYYFNISDNNKRLVEISKNAYKETLKSAIKSYKKKITSLESKVEAIKIPSSLVKDLLSKYYNQQQDEYNTELVLRSLEIALDILRDSYSDNSLNINNYDYSNFESIDSFNKEKENSNKSAEIKIVEASATDKDIPTSFVEIKKTPVSEKKEDVAERKKLEADMQSESTTKSNNNQTPIKQSKDIRYCRKCGAELTDDSIFCRMCGCKINK